MEGERFYGCSYYNECGCKAEIERLKKEIEELKKKPKRHIDTMTEEEKDSLLQMALGEGIPCYKCPADKLCDVLPYGCVAAIVAFLLAHEEEEK